MVKIAIVNGTYICLFPCETINESKENKDAKVIVAGVPVYLVQKFLTDRHLVISFFDSFPNDNLLDPKENESSNDDCNIEKHHFLEEIEVDLEYDILEYAYCISDETCPSPSTKITISQHHTIALVDNEDGIIIYPFHSHKSNKAMLFTNSPNKFNNAKILEVQNTDGYIVADFFLNGLDQILFLPKLDNIDDIFESGLPTLSMQKHILHTILSYSILTDSNCILHNKKNCTYTFGKQNSISTSTFTSSDDISLAPVIILFDTIDYSRQYTTSSNPVTLPHPVFSLNSNDQLKTDMDNAQNEKPIPAYLNQIDAVINQRLAQHNQFTQKKHSSLQMKKKSIIQSRKAIADLIDNEMNCAHIDTHIKSSENIQNANTIKGKSISLQLARLRYKIQHFGKSSFDVHMEVDIYLDDPSTKVVCQPTKESHKEPYSFHNIFLAASPTSNTCNFTKVDTTSGFVPTLLSNECVTISLSMSITDMVFHGTLEEPYATIALCIYWTMPRIRNITNSSNNVSFSKRNNFNFTPIDRDNGQTRGKILFLFRLPIEMILFHKKHQEQSWHYIDLKLSESYISSALFEHRNPRIVPFQSDSIETNIVPKQLFDKLEYDRVDWNTGFESDSIDEGVPSMVIFAESPEKRAALLKLVLQHLPNSAKVIPYGSEKRIEQNINSLLKAMENEVCLIQIHSKIPRECMSMEILREIGTLQCITDKIAFTNFSITKTFDLN